ncbi:conserved hypothetical protein [Culex quinquefasciatus]|uniref:DUF243 domain-containing protein n=1 Tax=Culex quinquefasciatus TaxID=7176 RepID=B0WJ36_CULQU|nr:conserved hypothetical protein [Culex quinquefasciatus]|eukprot:XP_001848720.1 conserved hypothetical protein [Culex quinquefasciatus]
MVFLSSRFWHVWPLLRHDRKLRCKDITTRHRHHVLLCTRQCPRRLPARVDMVGTTRHLPPLRCSTQPQLRLQCSTTIKPKLPRRSMDRLITRLDLEAHPGSEARPDLEALLDSDLRLVRPVLDLVACLRLALDPLCPREHLLTVVQKHIYVHVPPQEPEETRAQQVVSQGVPRKHYKIIFIKTPNVQPSAAQIALQQAQQEEKTIVYVLVKKPEDQADINIPQLAPLPPSKPEVYFIKYKANKGATGSAAGIANAISGSLGGAGFGGAISSGSPLSTGSGFGGAISSGSASSSSSSGHGFDAALGSSGSAISSGSK